MILLPREALPFWEGNDPPSDGRVIEAVSRWDDQEAATDFDRACDVMAWAEVLPVGTDSWGLVLPEDAGGIAWLTVDDVTDTFAIVQGVSFETDTQASYQSAWSEAIEDPAGWTPLQGHLTVRNGDLLLMPTATRGDEVREVAWNRIAQVGSAQLVQVPGGTYSLDQYILPDRDDKTAGAIFTRLQVHHP